MHTKVKKKAVQIVFDMICWVLVLLLTIAACVMLVSKAQNKLPFFFGKAIVGIKTGSMEPTILSGEYIQVRQADPGSIKEGDIISFYSIDPAIYGMLNTHRVVSVKEENGVRFFITKGDFNALEDTYPVTEDRVAAVFVKRLPGVTAVVNFLTQKFVLILLIIVPILLLVVPVFRSVLKKKHQQDIDRLLEEEINRLNEEKKNPEEPT